MESPSYSSRDRRGMAASCDTRATYFPGEAATQTIKDKRIAYGRGRRGVGGGGRGEGNGGGGRGGGGWKREESSRG